MRCREAIFCGSPPWCEIGWCESETPICGYVAPLCSRPIWNVMTRVESVWNASACMSNISRACSS